MVRITPIFIFWFAISVHADIITYDGNVFPETAGWERITFGTPVRSLENGEFVQVVDDAADFDAYRRSSETFTGKRFSLEWVCETDAPSELLDVSGTPVVVSAFGNAAANYHFTITDQRVRLIRDNFLPIVFVDITPHVSHKYRLELCPTSVCTEHLYAWFIDDRLIDSGVAEGPFPNPDSRLIWGVDHYDPGHMTRWDYLKFGDLEPIAAVSDWGVAVIIMLLLTVGTIVFGNRMVGRNVNTRYSTT